MKVPYPKGLLKQYLKDLYRALSAFRITGDSRSISVKETENGYMLSVITSPAEASGGSSGGGNADYDGMFKCEIENEYTGSGKPNDYYVKVTAGKDAFSGSESGYMGSCIINGVLYETFRKKLRELIEPAGDIYVLLRVPKNIRKASDIDIAYSDSLRTDSAAVYFPLALITWIKSVKTGSSGEEIVSYTPELKQIHRAGLITLSTISQSEIVKFTISGGTAESGYSGSYSSADGTVYSGRLFATEISYPEALTPGTTVLAHSVMVERLES